MVDDEIRSGQRGARPSENTGFWRRQRSTFQEAPSAQSPSRTLADPSTSSRDWGSHSEVLQSRAKHGTHNDAASLVQRAGTESVAEIERLIGQMQDVRQFLVSESERVQAEVTRLVDLSRSALAAVELIRGSVEQWRRALPQEQRPLQPSDNVADVSTSDTPADIDADGVQDDGAQGQMTSNPTPCERASEHET